MEINALLIGINYTGTSHQLSGCINDVRDIERILKEKFMVEDHNITIMTDNSSDYLKPYGVNMMNQLRILADKSSSSKCIFLHYSGHGSQVNDTNNDEKDGMDEVLCPLDYPDSYIKDDEFFSEFVSKVKCPLVILLDCCHSGTCGDLAYILNDHDTFTLDNKISGTDLLQIMISGCRDDQTSADASFPDMVTHQQKSQGAMTKSFCSSIEKLGSGATILSIIHEMRRFLKDNRYAQVPQLTSSKVFNTDNEKLALVCSNGNNNTTPNYNSSPNNYYNHGANYETTQDEVKYDIIEVNESIDSPQENYNKPTHGSQDIILDLKNENIVLQKKIEELENKLKIAEKNSYYSSIKLNSIKNIISSP